MKIQYATLWQKKEKIIKTRFIIKKQPLSRILFSNRISTTGKGRVFRNTSHFLCLNVQNADMLPKKMVTARNVRYKWSPLDLMISSIRATKNKIVFLFGLLKNYSAYFFVDLF